MGGDVADLAYAGDLGDFGAVDGGVCVRVGLVCGEELVDGERAEGVFAVGSLGWERKGISLDFSQDGEDGRGKAFKR